MTNIVHLRGTKEAPKAVRSMMETLIITADQVNQWRIPPFQRPVRVNAKVLAMAESLKQNGIEITGILTLGKIGKDETIYVIDGQHRLEAFKISEMKEIIVDVRVCQFETMAEAADEYVRLNSALVKMRPDDILRGLEASVTALKIIRKNCEFVGYDQIRRGTHGPILSMSAATRCWVSSAYETPASANSAGSAADLVRMLDPENAQSLVVFLLTAHSAWGRDIEYARLWSNLNLTLCMWLWRRLVLEKDRTGKRYALLTPTQFKQCLMSLSATSNYVDFLLGRKLGDRDRSPCYARIKSLFVTRLLQETKNKKFAVLPAPAWASK